MFNQRHQKQITFSIFLFLKMSNNSIEIVEKHIF